MNIEKEYWVYILLCTNQSYYTGYTDNLEKRYNSHVNGTGKCKYTRSFKPLKIAQCWHVKGDKLLALQLERQIKTYTKKQKETLIRSPELLSSDPKVCPYAPVF